ncbi:MAG TPA: carboxypeptidase-like regulatory domain-containing protein [Actinomycetota bacterium]
MRRFVLLVLPLALLLTSCGSPKAGNGTQDQGIRGIVLLGPVCPVESVQSPCPPRPLVDTNVEVTNEHGDVVATATTDQEGRFVVHLEPGAYSVYAVLVSPGPPSSHPVRVVVQAHEFAQVRVPVDSGIR